MIKTTTEQKQERLLAAYQALPGWPTTLAGLPLRQALSLARRQQSREVRALQGKYELVLAESRANGGRVEK